MTPAAASVAEYQTWTWTCEWMKLKNRSRDDAVPDFFHMIWNNSAYYIAWFCPKILGEIICQDKFHKRKDKQEVGVNEAEMMMGQNLQDPPAGTEGGAGTVSWSETGCSLLRSVRCGHLEAPGEKAYSKWDSGKWNLECVWWWEGCGVSTQHTGAPHTPPWPCTCVASGSCVVRRPTPPCPPGSPPPSSSTQVTWVRVSTRLSDHGWEEGRLHLLEFFVIVIYIVFVIQGLF